MVSAKELSQLPLRQGASEIVKAQFEADGAILNRSAEPKSGKQK